MIDRKDHEEAEERVAIALYVSTIHNMKPVGDAPRFETWDEAGSENKDHYRMLARAAIHAAGFTQTVVAIDLAPVYDRVVALLAYDGWPPPYARYIAPLNNAGLANSHLIWRHGGEGSSVSLVSYRFQRYEHEVVRHYISPRIIKDDRWIIVDGGELIVTGENCEASHIADALRPFKGIVSNRP
jgi:hypothetical protein